MKAAICPVCGGNGIVDEGFHRQTSGQWTSAGGVETCRSCGGTGWVTIHEPEGLPFAHPYNTEPLSHLKAETTTDAEGWDYTLT